MTVASLRPCVAATATSESGAAAVDGELMEQRLLVAVQEVVAPVDEPLQRGPGRIGRRGVAQERRPALEDRDELRETEHVDTCSGELERERKPVDATGDLGRERDSLAVRLEARPRCARTLEEQLHGRRASLRADSRNRERRYRNPCLAREVKGLAARRQDPHPGRLGQQRRGDSRRLLENVLARVEDDERSGVAKPGGDACERVIAANLEDVGQEANGVGGRPRTREVDDPDSVGELGFE